MTQLTRTANWFFYTGQMPQQPTPDVAQVCFYLGMQLEELAEKLQALRPDSEVAALMQKLGGLFQAQDHDVIQDISARLADPAVAADFLDGDLDTLWVTVGAIRALGTDPEKAYEALLASNYGKRWTDGTFHVDDNGRVQKPPEWRKPNFAGFIHADWTPYVPASTATTTPEAEGEA